MSNKTTWFYVVLYLFAIVAANLLVARFGPSVTIINAFLFIGLDLTTRDGLHEAWGKNGLWWKMLLLIGAGSLISYALNSAAGQIALASFVAFAAAGVTDTIVYQALHKRAWMVKVNGSNVASAAVDSIAFPTIAFGAFLPLIVLGQFAAKVGGGFMWAWIIGKFRVKRVETEPA
ncbi:MAG: VUT family protein [Anaerolineae bacterium]|mgnify:FL=1